MDNIPFRQGVQVYVLREGKKFLIVCQPSGGWKVISGGIEQEESITSATEREISEELGVSVKIIAQSKHRNEFLWPKALVEQYGYQWKGQSQVIVLVKLEDPSAIVPDPKEIVDYKWITKEEAPNYLTFPNQLETAQKVFAEFPEYF